MSPTEVLLAYLGRSMRLNPEHIALVRSMVTERRVQKSAFLQRAGVVPHQAFFVTGGCLRSYTIDEDGIEHTLGFAPEDWWLTDITAVGGEPTQLFIQALEDSEVAVMPLTAHDLFVERIPGYAAGYSAGLRKSTASRERRILAAISESAEQRYVRFLETYPRIAQRVPQHMIASYLGVKPETLSRVRRRLATRRA